MNESPEYQERMERFDRKLEHLVNVAAAHDGRIGRLEDALERMLSSHEQMLSSQRQLLTAQVLFVDEARTAIKKLGENDGKRGAEMADLREQVAQTTANVNALLQVVDGIIRDRQA